MENNEDDIEKSHANGQLPPHTLQWQQMTTRQILTAIQDNQEICATYFQELSVRARLLEYTEQQYADLCAVVKTWLKLVNQLPIGGPVSEAWLQERDALAVQARRLLDDPP